MTTVSATIAREKLYDLIEEVAQSGKKIGITNKGETKAVLISPEELDAWTATIETLQDPEMVKVIYEGDKDIKAGRIYNWKDVKKTLGLDASDKTFKPGKKKSKKIR